MGRIDGLFLKQFSHRHDGVGEIVLTTGDAIGASNLLLDNPNKELFLAPMVVNRTADTCAPEPQPFPPPGSDEYCARLFRNSLRHIRDVESYRETDDDGNEERGMTMFCFTVACIDHQMPEFLRGLAAWMKSAQEPMK